MLIAFSIREGGGMQILKGANKKKNSMICLEGKSMTPSSGKRFSFPFLRCLRSSRDTRPTSGGLRQAQRSHEALGRRKIERRALPWGKAEKWGRLCASVFCELCTSAEARAISFSVLRASCCQMQMSLHFDVLDLFYPILRP